MQNKSFHITLWLLLFCAVFQHQPLHAQSSKTFVKSSRVTPQYDRNKIQAELEYARAIFQDSISTALDLVEKNLFLAIQAKYQPEEALAYHILGDFNRDLSSLPSAVSNYTKAIRVYRQIPEQKNDLIQVLTDRGQIQLNLQKIDLAIKDWEEALTLVKTVNTPVKEVDLLIKIGEVYTRQSQFSKARSTYDQALKKATQANYDEGIVNANIGLGKVKEQTGENKEAVKFYNSAKLNAERIDQAQLTNSSYNSLSGYFQNQQDIPQTIAIEQEALNYNKARGNNQSAIANYTNIANAYIEIGETDEAIEILNESAPLIQEEQNSFVKRNYYKTLSDVLEQKGDTKKAAEVRSAYQVLMDSFQLLENQKQDLIAEKNDRIQFTENRILLLEKDREINEKTIQLLEQEQEFKNEVIKRQHTITILLVIGLVIIAVMAFFIYRNNKQKQISNQLLTLKIVTESNEPAFYF